MRFTRWLSLAALGALLCGAGLQAAEKKPLKELPSFGLLRGMSAEQAQAAARDWLTSTGKADAATLAQFDRIWKSDRVLVDKVAQSLALGEPAVKTLLDQARDPDAAAPTTVPALIKDKKRPVFFRANLALAYAKALSGRRVYEEALAALKATRAEDVADPATYLFHRAVAEHALLLKEPAEDSVDRLLSDVADAPERYRMVAALMHFDMLTWREKDLGWISRKMNVIKDRLDIARGGKKTQKMQKEVLVRLDEMIKEMENRAKGSSQSNGGNCPSGGQPKNGPGGLFPGSPMQDSNVVTGQQGKGEVDIKKVKEIAEVWGKLPEKERAKAMVELTRDLPPKYRDAIEAYFKQLNSKSGSR